jgi:pilus assembly protein Flp/PilA
MMNKLSVKVMSRIQAMMMALSSDDGQDIVEYALVVALIAFAAVSSVNSLATSINDSFTKMDNSLTTNIT